MSAAHNLQEEGENVDYVCVDLEGTIDVFLRADGVFSISEHQLGIICQELKRQRKQFVTCFESFSNNKAIFLPFLGVQTQEIYCTILHTYFLRSPTKFKGCTPR